MPYDRDYCTLLVDVRGGGQKEFFACLFDLATYPREKKYCNLFYPFDGKESNSTEGIKILDERYKCYAEYLRIPIDRDYCELRSSNESQFYDCVQKHRLNTKADFCIWREKERSEKAIKDAGSMFLYGGSNDYQRCL